MSIADDYGIPHSEFKSWDDDDQDKVVAYRIFKAKHCSQCGTSEDDWRRDRFAYEAEVLRCRGCEILQLTEEDLRQQRGTAGMRVVLKKSTPSLPKHKH